SATRPSGEVPSRISTLTLPPVRSSSARAHGSTTSSWKKLFGPRKWLNRNVTSCADSCTAESASSAKAKAERRNIIPSVSQGLRAIVRRPALQINVRRTRFGDGGLTNLRVAWVLLPLRRVMRPFAGEAMRAIQQTFAVLFAFGLALLIGLPARAASVEELVGAVVRIKTVISPDGQTVRTLGRERE